MNPDPSPLHPPPETWADYLYGELAPARLAEVETHVRDCPDCQRQLAQHRETQKALAAWTLPLRTRRPVAWASSLRWAVAAGLVLGLGWLGGRLSQPALPSTEALRAEWVPALRAELRQEWETELAGAVRAAEERTQNRLLELAQAWATARQEDQQIASVLFQQAERQRRADYAALRHDLETVAVVAQDAIGTTQAQLTQLAVNALPPVPDENPIPR